MTSENQFDVIDLIVFAATVVISLGIGIFYAFKDGGQKTTAEYLLGGRLISFIPVAISLMVSFESSIMLLGMPAEGYHYGIQFVLGSVFFFFSQVFAAIVIPPLIHPLRITSAYEYLELRFNSRSVRLLGTVAGMFIYCFYMGIVLFGPAVALEAVTGFPKWASIVVISVVAVIYTSIGGLKAVVWTDVFQAFIMFAGIFAILIKGTMEVGGPKQVWDIAEKGGRLNFFEFDMDPRTRHTFSNLLFTTFIRGFALAFNQSSIQRISSTKSVKEARNVLLIVAPGFAISSALCVYEGTLAYTYYQTKGCDPFESKKLTNPNQIIPFFVMDIFKGLYGMPGLFLASLFSASMSTLSSGLSSMSALLWADFIKPLAGDISDIKGTIIAKISVLVFGGCSCGLAFLVSLIGGTLTQITFSLLSAFSGPITGLFLAGIFCPRITAKGAFWGSLVSLVFTSWISFGMNFSPAVKKTPFLPPASTDKCFLLDSQQNQTSHFFPNATDNLPYYTSSSMHNPSVFNQTHYHHHHSDDNNSTSKLYHDVSSERKTTLLNTMTTVMDDTNDPTTRQNQDVSEVTGVDVLYTLSYLYVSLVGTVTALICSFIISVLTGVNKPGDVDPRYLLPVSETWLILLPGPLKRWIGSIGPQFMKEEYKKRFPDPALRFEADNHELVVIPPSRYMDTEEPLLTKYEPKTEPPQFRTNGSNTEAVVLVRAELGINSNSNGSGRLS